MGCLEPSVGLLPTEVREPVGGQEVVPDRPWVVVVWNDPVNLMSYVTYVFQKLFGYSRDKATKLMLDVHQKGKAVVSNGTGLQANGSIRLEAAQGAHLGSGGVGNALVSSQGGKLTIGPQSDMEILPELLSSATAMCFRRPTRAITRWWWIMAKAPSSKTSMATDFSISTPELQWRPRGTVIHTWCKRSSGSASPTMSTNAPTGSRAGSASALASRAR